MPPRALVILMIVVAVATFAVVTGDSQLQNPFTGEKLSSFSKYVPFLEAPVDDQSPNESTTLIQTHSGSGEALDPNPKTDQTDNLNEVPAVVENESEPLNQTQALTTSEPKLSIDATPDVPKNQDAITPPIELSSSLADRESLIMNWDADSYTLQISTASAEGNAKRYIEQHGLGAAATYYLLFRNDRTWYPVVFGTFSSFKEAEKALATLPRKVRKAKPWVRQIKNVQNSILERSTAQNQ